MKSSGHLKAFKNSDWQRGRGDSTQEEWVPWTLLLDWETVGKDWTDTMGLDHWKPGMLNGFTFNTVRINNTKVKALEQGNEHKKCLKELNPITA